SSQPPVRALDADQMFKLHQKFVTTPLPSKTLFPWLHGVDGCNGQQNYFFGIEQFQQLYGTGENGSVGPCDILQAIPSSERSPSITAVTPMVISTTTTTTTTTSEAVIDANGHSTTATPNTSMHDINHHPQIHHQYSTVSVVHQQQKEQQQQQQQQQQQEQQDSDWTDISDDSSSSFLGSIASPSSPLSSSPQNNNDTNDTNDTQNYNNNSDTNPQLSVKARNPFAELLQQKFLYSLSDGINIRNFKIQVPRYALLSDLIIYTKEGERDPFLMMLAELVSHAQEAVWSEMKQHYPQLSIQARRHTFVLTDTFETIEAKYPELIAVSNAGQATKNRVDFWDQEREQMSLLTRASEIAPGIWANFQPSICVECRPGTTAPTTITLDRIKSNVASTPEPLPVKEIFHLECLGTLAAGVNPELFPPSISSLSALAGQVTVDISSNHAVRRNTASELVTGHELTRSILQAQVTQLLNMAFFITSVASPSSNTDSTSTTEQINSSTNTSSCRQNSQSQKHQVQEYPHQVLIHCVDGYTETALLALAVVMIHHRLSLAEAFLKLQNDLGRSFFVYPNDSIMMLEVENQVWQRIQSQQRAAKEAVLTPVQQRQNQRQRERTTSASSTSSSIKNLGMSSEDKTNGVSNNMIQSATSLSSSPPSSPPSSSSGLSSLSSSLSSSSSFFSSLLNINGSVSTQQQQQQSSSSLTPKTDTMEGIEINSDKALQIEIDEDMVEEPLEEEIKPFLRPGHEEACSWFYNPEFEGSFPSRILPFLYLGNLAHASNPGLLKSLGIQYVLSVGEEAHGLANAEYSSSDSEHKESMEVDHEEPKRFLVKFVDDMYDNGVDSLWKHLESCVDFVDEARRNHSRILIHCRVGVSRSATIVIAYLMAHYRLSLVDAYLMVRARRLSVIIQPNLLFMYELLQWEQQLKGRFDSMGWPGIAREVHSLNMYYIGG
ncbi:tyrosine/serine/threonine protein phosphatase pps1, partial [Gryganskiella cystojenkinii]